MAQVRGYVEKIKFRNEENGYSILSVSEDGDEKILVGIFPVVSEGDFIEAEGEETLHPVYGDQLRVTRHEIRLPEDAAAMERYLSSGAVKGIRGVLAARIVAKFGSDTFRVIEEEPERLCEVKGVSERLARSVSAQMSEKRELRQAIMYLSEYGISMSLGLKIYNKYGPKMYGILRENPYRLAEDINGVGFRAADEIAARMGIGADSDFRIRSGILYCLQQALAAGHTCLPQSELAAVLPSLLGTDGIDLEKYLLDLSIDKKLVAKADGNAEEYSIYLANVYRTEFSAACMLADLNISGDEDRQKIYKKIDDISKETGLEPDVNQREAVCRAVTSGLVIITGGPGTGKTTTINTIIRYFENEGMSVLLAAPTGRAAKRMSEATGCEAKTIHRMLEIGGGMDEDDDKSRMQFGKNSDSPLEADAVIIDEVSMVDIFLLHALLDAIVPGTRVILVGDASQLPSVGPGNVLRDMIDSGAFPVVRLEHIFRQAAQSDIIVNAHRINEGLKVDLTKRSRDFLFIRGRNAEDISKSMIALLKEKLPAYVNASPFDIQVLSPMKKGPLGVEGLNVLLQEKLNPPSNEKTEREIGGTIFRLGDKVMQIRNNYQARWEIKNARGMTITEGSGVFNGDIGMVKDIDLFSEEITVEYDDSREVVYPFKGLDELELAYAVTVHKSQGSEYPAVVIPICPGPRMLMNRNLIYTAVTRARKCVCLIGFPDTFQEMVDNADRQKRHTGLVHRVMEICMAGAEKMKYDKKNDLISD